MAINSPVTITAGQCKKPQVFYILLEPIFTNGEMDQLSQDQENQDYAQDIR